MLFITYILYAYWIFDISLVLLGLPHTLNLVKLPAVLKETLLYGKTRGNSRVETSIVKLIEIPKSWFLHFYIYGVVISLYTSCVTIGSYYLGVEVPGAISLDSHVRSPRQSLDKLAVTMVCIMMLIQHIRRTYESMFVSVYSKGTMNVIHYLMAAYLYSTVQVCAIAEGPSLKSSTNAHVSSTLFHGQWLLFLQQHWNKLLGFGLFIMASYQHHRSHVILANLRKDRRGEKVIHRQHVIPRGGLFECLSAPHFVAEILIYVSMGLVALENWSFWLGPVLFTFTNQALMINETHNWYVSKFSNYPKNRYRYIPYIF